MLSDNLEDFCRINNIKEKDQTKIECFGRTCDLGDLINAEDQLLKEATQFRKDSGKHAIISKCYTTKKENGKITVELFVLFNN